MAKFELELPTDIINTIQKVYDNSDEIFGEMTRAGADVVAHNIRETAPDVIKPYVRKTKTYKTPSDDGINTKAYISGYIPFSGNRTKFSRAGGNGKTYVTSKGVPADFLAMLYEYGRSTAPFPKHPFLRKAFKRKEIEEAMLKTQSKASGGIL